MNEREIIEVAALDAGKRLDAFVAEAFPELSRSRAQSLCESGDVTVNGKPVKKNHKLLEGDSVAVLLPEPESVEIVPQDIPLNIVYEDDSVLVACADGSTGSSHRLCGDGDRRNLCCILDCSVDCGVIDRVVCCGSNYAHCQYGNKGNKELFHIKKD